eukprot:TRINITY_DN35043_c0_g1_i1.p1 TRINITY_DN35043_c0_g1~~TRINITY_DN35043_c0_g1_i1.p1  ORF type:complete len:496 (+),score=56.09 TRINITY_DN35043_c0_g1_i1:146-1633(+)
MPVGGGYARAATSHCLGRMPESTEPYQPGDAAEVFSATKQTWLPATVMEAQDGWVTVMYADRALKNLPSSHEHLRPAARRTDVTSGMRIPAGYTPSRPTPTPQQGSRGGKSCPVGRVRPDLPQQTAEIGSMITQPGDKLMLTPRANPLLQQTTSVVLCPRGHAMDARVVKEMWSRLGWGSAHPDCSRCHTEISRDDARYFCKLCKYSLCLNCANSARDDSTTCPTPQTGTASGQSAMSPTVQVGTTNWIMAGDLILCGPDKWGIHHVVLCQDDMKPVPELHKTIGLPEHEDLFVVKTLESSRHLHGEDVPWYSGFTYYARCRRTGQVKMVADDEGEDDDIDVHDEFLPIKMLFHPLRPKQGGPEHDLDLFKRAIQDSAEESKRWGLRTALKAITSKKESLDAADYATPDSRVQMIEELEKSWHQRPICSSVAIKVWQRYFLLLNGCCGTNKAATERAACDILKWMPCRSDRTAPSTLIKVLSRSGWVLRDTLNAS